MSRTVGVARRVAGGVAWGNALGGYKTQIRDSRGRFSTRAKVNMEKQRQRAYVRAANVGLKNARLRQSANARAQKRESAAAKAAMDSVGTKNKVKIGATVAGVAATGALYKTINPSVSISRKNVSMSVSPRKNLFGNVDVYSSHSVGLERRGDDFIDRKVASAQEGLSRGFRSVLADNAQGRTTGDIFDAVILGRKDKDGYAKVNGKRIYVDGSLANRRVRWGGGNSTAGVPGAPMNSGGTTKTRAKPKGGRASSSTITGTVKVANGVQVKPGRSQRRNQAKKRKKKR